MKTRVTVSLERDLVPRAKRHADRLGLSLSALIEQDLQRAVNSGRRFSEAWRGKLSLADRPDSRYRQLAAKHQ